MKAIILAVALAVSTPAMAEDPSPIEICTQMSKAGKAVMSARQRGVEMALAMKLASEAQESLRPMLIAMVQLAYDKPAYRAEDNQARAITEFGDVTFQLCYQNFS